MTRYRFSASLLALAVCPAVPVVAQVPSAPRATPDADALADAMRQLATNPRDVDALVSAGDLSLRLGDMSGAASLFARAEKVDPMNARVKAGMGSILVQEERPGAALRYFDQAVGYGLDPRVFAADRGLAYDLIGEQARAQRDYRTAMATAPSDELTRRYALSLGIAGRKEQAFALLDPLLRKQDRSAWRARAFILAMGGDQTGANTIATSMMPGFASGLRPFFQRLPSLPAAERAFAVHFGEIRPTPQRIADARLVPALAPLAPEAGAPTMVAAASPPAGVRIAAAPVRADARGRDVAAVQPRAAIPAAVARAPAATVFAQPAPVQAAGPVAVASVGQRASIARQSIAPSASAAIAPQVGQQASVTARASTVPGAVAAIAPRPLAPVVAAVPAVRAPTAVVAAVPGLAPQASPVAAASVVPGLPTPVTGNVLVAGGTVPTAYRSPNTAVAGAATGVQQSAASYPAAVAATSPAPAASIGQVAALGTAAPVLPGSVSPGVGLTTGLGTSAPSGIASAAPVGGAPVALAAASPMVAGSAAVPAPAVAPAALAPSMAFVQPVPREDPVPEPRARPTRAPRAMNDSILAKIVAGIQIPEAELAAAPAAAPTPGRRTRRGERVAEAVATGEVETASTTPPAAPGRRTRRGDRAAAVTEVAAVETASATPARRTRRGERVTESAASDTETVAPNRRARRGDKAVAEPVETAAVSGRRGRRGEAAAAEVDAPVDRKTAAARKLADRKGAERSRADKEAADEAADAKKVERAQPSRIWVQVAGGANEGDLTKAWSATKAKAPALAGKSAYATPLRATNRVLTGPFKTDAEARAFVNTLAKQGVSAFSFTSEAGQKVARLPSK